LHLKKKWKTLGGYYFLKKKNQKYLIMSSWTEISHQLSYLKEDCDRLVSENKKNAVIIQEKEANAIQVEIEIHQMKDENDALKIECDRTLMEVFELERCIARIVDKISWKDFEKPRLELAEVRRQFDEKKMEYFHISQKFQKEVEFPDDADIQYLDTQYEKLKKEEECLTRQLNDFKVANANLQKQIESEKNIIKANISLLKTYFPVEGQQLMVPNNLETELSSTVNVEDDLNDDEILRELQAEHAEWQKKLADVDDAIKQVDMKLQATVINMNKTSLKTTHQKLEKIGTTFVLSPVESRRKSIKTNNK